MAKRKTNIVKAEVISVSKESNQKIERTSAIDGIQDPPYSIEAYTNLYTYNGYHSACISLKAQMTAGLGYEIVPINEEKELDSKNNDEYKLLKEFLDTQALKSGQTFIETLVNFQTDFEIYGHAFLEVVRNAKGDVAEIYHLPAREIEIQYKDKKIYAIQEVDQTTVIFYPFGDDSKPKGTTEFLMLKSYNPKSRFYGQPDYLGAVGAIILDRDAVEYNINKFDNNAIPEHVITVTGGQFDKDTKAKIKDFFTNNYKGTDNAGRALLLEADANGIEIDIKPVGSEIKEASFKALRIDCRDEIISAHRIPKRILGIAEAGSLGTEGKTQLKMFQDDVIEPKQARLEFLLNEKIVKEGLQVKNWKIQLTRQYIDDPQADAIYYQTLINMGVLTTDEARAELGYGIKEVDNKTKEDDTKEGESLVKSLKNLRKQLEDELPN